MPNRSRWYALAMLSLAPVLSAAALALSIGYTQHAQDLADRRQVEQQQREQRALAAGRQQSRATVCAWLRVRVDPQAPPPTTSRGVEQLESDRVLYRQFGCPPLKPAPTPSPSTQG